MAQAFNLAQLTSGTAIVDASGFPTPTFLLWWQENREALISTLNGILSIPGIQQAIANAQATADAAQLTADQALAAATNPPPTTQTVGLGSTITKKVAAGATVTASAQGAVNAGGTSGMVKITISAGISGGTLAVIATSPGTAVSATEGGSDSVSASYTNTTGTDQLFDFQGALVRTPTGAGGPAITSQSFLTV